MFVFCQPEESERLHQSSWQLKEKFAMDLTSHTASHIPTGDLGGPAYRKFDIEAWMTMKSDPAAGVGGRRIWRNY